MSCSIQTRHYEPNTRPYLNQPHNFLSRMNEARAFAAGAHHPQLGFLVSGGYDGYSSLPSSTSEISTDGMTFSTFTPLPIAVYRHCMVALDRDDGEFFLAGGSTGPSSRRAFIHRRSHWDEVEPMQTGREGKKSNLKMQIRYDTKREVLPCSPDVRPGQRYSWRKGAEDHCSRWA